MEKCFIEHVGITDVVKPSSAEWRRLCVRFPNNLVSVASGKVVKRSVVCVDAIVNGIRFDDILCAFYGDRVGVLGEHPYFKIWECYHEFHAAVKGVCDEIFELGLSSGGDVLDFYYDETSDV
ncbi:MAG: hypothetical protein WCT36_03795 [Candidatus Gracilibacteria bacterium]